MAHWHHDPYEHRGRADYRHPPSQAPRNDYRRDWEEGRLRDDRRLLSPPRRLICDHCLHRTATYEQRPREPPRRDYWRDPSPPRRDHWRDWSPPRHDYRRDLSPPRRDYRRDWEERRLPYDSRPYLPRRDDWHDRDEHTVSYDRREVSPPRSGYQHRPRPASPRAPWERERFEHTRRPASPRVPWEQARFEHSGRLASPGPREPQHFKQERQSSYERRAPPPPPRNPGQAWRHQQSQITPKKEPGPEMYLHIACEMRMEDDDRYLNRPPVPLTNMRNPRGQQPPPLPDLRIPDLRQLNIGVRQPQPHLVPSADTRFMTGGHLMVLPVPRPGAEYQYKARTDDGVYELKPFPLLLILDLNGTLIHRPNKAYPTRFVSRPLLAQFLEHVFSRYKVMIWSSACSDTVRYLVKQILSPDQLSKVVAVWDRKSLRLSPQQYEQKTATYKQLSWVWADEGIQATHPTYSEGGRWGQNNTLMVDDSVEKAAAEPHNHIAVPVFTDFASDAKLGGRAVLEHVAGYLHTLRHAKNVCWFVRAHDFGVSAASVWFGLKNPANRTHSGLPDGAGANANTPSHILDPRTINPDP